MINLTKSVPADTNKICKHCKFYEVPLRGDLKRHENNCWANPNSLKEMNTDWYCNICQVRFMTASAKEVHNKEAEHSIKKDHVCHYCNKRMLTNDFNYYKHEKLCMNEDNHIVYLYCDYCNYADNNEDIMEKHKMLCYKNPTNKNKTEKFAPIKNCNNTNNIGIYKITTPNNKVYIGMTTDSFKNRWAGHLKSLKNPNKNHHCKGLQSAFDKYGWDNLKKEIVEEYTKPNTLEELNLLTQIILDREIYWWNECNRKFIILNGKPTGTGSVYHLEDTRRRIANSVYTYNTNNLKSDKTIKLFNKVCVLCNSAFTSKAINAKYCNNCKSNKKKNISLKKKKDRNYYKKITDNDYNNIKNMYESGKTIQNIADHYNVALNTIYKFMKKHNIERRSVNHIINSPEIRNKAQQTIKSKPKVKCIYCGRECASNVIKRHEVACKDKSPLK